MTFTFKLILQEKPDAYDKLVNEMVLDIRARPSNRTKTPEEIAQEEKERLEQLEVYLDIDIDESVYSAFFLCPFGDILFSKKILHWNLSDF